MFQPQSTYPAKPAVYPSAQSPLSAQGSAISTFATLTPSPVTLKSPSAVRAIGSVSPAPRRTLTPPRRLDAAMAGAAGAQAPPSGQGPGPRDLFDAMDTNGDGMISRAEFLAATPPTRTIKRSITPTPVPVHVAGGNSMWHWPIPPKGAEVAQGVRMLPPQLGQANHMPLARVGGFLTPPPNARGRAPGPAWQLT